MFKVKLTGLNGVKAQFASAAKNARKIVSEEVEGMAQEWVKGAVKDAPADEATLRKGISYYMQDDLNAVIVSNAFYSPFMEFGTKGKYRAISGTEAIAAQFKGYKGGDFMALLRNIVRWVKRKGITGTYSVKTRRRTGARINQIAEDYAAAWPIAMSILKNGVNPHPFFFKQQEVVWPAGMRKIKQRLEAASRVRVILPGEINRPRIVTI